MSSFSTLLNLQISIFLILMTGLFFRKINLITSSVRQGLSDLLINLILPCNIVASFDLQLSGEIWVMVSEILLISLCVQLFVWALSKVLYRRVPHGPREVLQYGTITSNSGFLGNPMAEGIFGEMGLLYASVAMLPIRVIMWSAGVSLYTRTSGKAVLKKLITHPCIIAVLIGFAVLLLPVPLPVFVSKTLHYVGDCTTCVSMLVIGSILAEIQLRELHWRRHRAPGRHAGCQHNRHIGGEVQWRCKICLCRSLFLHAALSAHCPAGPAPGVKNTGVRTFGRLRFLSRKVEKE